MYFLSVEGVNDSLRSTLLPEPLLNSSSSLASCNKDTPPTAAANGSLTSSPLTSAEVTLLGLLFGLFWVVSVLGNSLVCLVIHRSRRTQSTTNYFVVSLACSDLLLSLACAPLVLLQVCVGHWPLTASACKVLRFLQHLCPGAQLYVLLSICVDRFYTIVYPLSFKVSREKAKRMILASWLLDALFVSPCLFFYGSSQNRCDFFLPGGWDGLSYSLAHLLLGFLLPALLILSFYHRVVRYIWRIGADGRTVRRTMNVVPRTKVKTIKMFLILNCMFLLSWMPFYVAQLWHPAETTALGRDRPDLLLFITVVWISFSSTASKPTIYSVYNANFRRGMRETFCMSSMKCYRSNAYTITASSRVAKKNYVGILDLSVPPKTLVKDSVYDTFDREAKEKKLAWPISTNPPNTFV